ncbi:homoserine dehydrogenase family protein [Lysobacter solisilvae (ex Woo and Kim 2020)]|uniref:Homoserine dehydrogenase n=1 Tax=Agrilutibacter terrestris TaxID=2865112 RepID=A0A7H0FYU5_9GAMM|nr:homoserine dehydrogenase [Lysobacter terrestris]QNP41211.1 homoserine dehydrogenase [Lysobacter terrestris]
MNVAAQAFVSPRVLARPVAATASEATRVALLGTGTVGRAVLARLDAWSGTALGERLQLVHVANSRVAVRDAAGLCPRQAAGLLGVAPVAVDDARRPAPEPSSLDAIDAVLGTTGGIVIDATASEDVAARHAGWLAQGVHVVTACKLGQGTSLRRWREIRAACHDTGAQYGDSATVGAGLPLLRSLRELQAGGDRIHAFAGILSGSLAWLFNHYDGMRPFSALVRQARDAGYTEPDPRDDLSGEDVRRKTVILARAAGFEIEPHDVEVDSLVPRELALLSKAAVDAALPALDVPLRQRFAGAYKKGEKLRFVARLETREDGRSHARVGLEALPADHPLAAGAGTDNKVAIWSDRYATQPLVIQGPGAGAEVTAAGLLDDALRVGRPR